MDNDYLTIEDFSALLPTRVNERTLRRWIKREYCPPLYRVGLKRFFKRGEAMAWIDAPQHVKEEQAKNRLASREVAAQ